jgi:hypothetical protein
MIMTRILSCWAFYLPAAVILIAAGSAPSHEPIASDNLAANPSFEAVDEDGRWPTAWSGDRQVLRHLPRNGPQR